MWLLSFAGLSHELYDLGYDVELGALLQNDALDFAAKRGLEVVQLVNASIQIDLDLNFLVDYLHELTAHAHLDRRLLKQVLLIDLTLLARLYFLLEVLKHGSHAIVEPHQVAL